METKDEMIEELKTQLSSTTQQIQQVPSHSRSNSVSSSRGSSRHNIHRDSNGELIDPNFLLPPEYEIRLILEDYDQLHNENTQLLEQLTSLQYNDELQREQIITLQEQFKKNTK